MPIDPILQGFLDQLAAQPMPKVHELPAPLAREAFNALMQLVGPKDVPIGKIENRTIPGPGGEIPIRIYTPIAAGSEPLPVLVYFHGGGFVIGNLDTHDGCCRILSDEAHCRVIAVDYRLAPENQFPAAVDDAFAALNWVEENASALGVDANRIAVGGDSAGGNLSAVVSQLAKQKGKPKICFQLLLFAATDVAEELPSRHDFGVGYFLEKQTLDWFFEQYVPPGAKRTDPKLSPLRATDLSGLPPAYVVVAGYDPLHDEGLAYAEKLRAAGVKVTVAGYPDMVHCFTYMQTVLPQAREALVAASQVLKAAFAAG
jgi:acetyl esterase